MHVMKDKFNKRGYKEQQLDIAVEKINETFRVDLFKGVQKRRKGLVPLFIIKYSCCAEMIKPVVYRPSLI